MSSTVSLPEAVNSQDLHLRADNLKLSIQKSKPKDAAFLAATPDHLDQRTVSKAVQRITSIERAFIKRASTDGVLLQPNDLLSNRIVCNNDWRFDCC